MALSPVHASNIHLDQHVEKQEGEGVGTSKLIYRDGLKVHQYCVALAWAECFRDQRPQSVFVSIESATRSTYLNYTFVSFRVRKQSSNATNIGHSSLDLGISLSPFVYELFLMRKSSHCATNYAALLTVTGNCMPRLSPTVYGFVR